MTIAMLIAGPDAAEPNLGPDVAARLSEMGISRLSILADSSGIAVVVEGWAFDSASAGDAVRAMFPDDGPDVRIFHEVELVALSGAGSGGAARSRRALAGGGRGGRPEDMTTHRPIGRADRRRILGAPRGATQSRVLIEGEWK
ncbi:MAG: hypothetical protein HY264_10185 [Chloroflexi bacterium]|nr:hypothetical protein [Chloroflexota bacterium]